MRQGLGAPVVAGAALGSHHQRAVPRLVPQRRRRHLVDRDVVAFLGAGHVRSSPEHVTRTVAAEAPAAFVVETLQVAHGVLQRLERGR